MLRSSLLASFATKLVRQCGLLIGMQGVAMILSFALTIMIARHLDVAAYGTFRYAMTFLALAMTILQFGSPYSAARLLALEADPSAQKEIVGACAIFVGLSTIIGIVGTLLLVFGAEMLGYHLPRILLWIAPALYVTLGQSMLGNICQGLNRISLLSLQQVLPYVFLLPITAVQIFVLREYSLAAALITYVAAFSVVIAMGFANLGVAFGHWQSWFRAIVRENRRTGFPIYVGGIFGVASAQLIALWVSEFADSVQYGQYALALAVSSPLSVLISSVGTVIFRSSSALDVLSTRLLRYSFALAGLLGLVFLVATQKLLVLAFGNQYAPAVQMAQMLGLAALLIGGGDIFHRFLGAHGQGKALCMAAVATGTVAMISAAILMPKFAVFGAIASALLASATYLGSLIALYIRYTRQGRGERAVLAGDSMTSKA